MSAWANAFLWAKCDVKEFWVSLPVYHRRVYGTLFLIPRDPGLHPAGYKQSLPWDQSSPALSLESLKPTLWVPPPYMSYILFMTSL